MNENEIRARARAADDPQAFAALVLEVTEFVMRGRIIADWEEVRKIVDRLVDGIFDDDTAEDDHPVETIIPMWDVRRLREIFGIER